MADTGPGPGYGPDKENARIPMNSTIVPKLVIPQLRIPQLNVDTNPNTAEALAAQEAQHRATDAHNKWLLSEIKRRREQNDTTIPQASPGTGQLPTLNGFTIPKLRSASVVPQLNIPLLNKLHSQNNSMEVKQLEQGVNKLHLHPENMPKTLRELEQEQTVLIDLTSTVIAVPKNAPPREAATKVLSRKAVAEQFEIPFISCDNLRSRLNEGLLPKKVDDDLPIVEIVEKSSIIGEFMDRTVGYPNPRKPQLKYAATPLELMHLKMYKREDYGSNIKRFRFDTPSPDEKIKEALQKSWRISRT